MQRRFLEGLENALRGLVFLVMAVMRGRDPMSDGVTHLSKFLKINSLYLDLTALLVLWWRKREANGGNVNARRGLN